jgi:hypothetical protein
MCRGRGRYSRFADDVFVRKEPMMAAPRVSARRMPTEVANLSGVSAVIWCSGTVFIALLVLYFVGLDQGASSVFGADSHIHEFLHDARHLLGYPCH